jgi:diguanylate cyclase (GGDEF)-like protein/PAS domain S-box-containing protein
MNSSAAGITRKTAWLLTLLAGVTAAYLPLGYFGLSYQHRAASLQAEAEMNARIVSQLINRDPDFWQFENHRLEEILARRSGARQAEIRRIVDAGHRVVAVSADRLDWPVVTRAGKLLDSGRVVGELQVSRSLRDVVIGTAFAALLGLCVYLVLRVFPLRALHLALDSLSREKERALVTLNSIGDAVIAADRAGRIEYLNPVAEQLTGWSNGDAYGKPLPQIFNAIDEATGEPLEAPAGRVLPKGRSAQTAERIALVTHSGRLLPIKHTAAPLRDRGGQTVGVVLVFQDASSAREMSDRLTYQATHDAITGLINRREFEQRLDQALLSAQREDKQHALCYLDLDQFKIVNDTCGHIAGDELLRQVTRLFQSKVRGADTLARLGGDEFGLLLVSCPLDQAEQRAEQVLAAARDFRFVWQDKVFAIGVSIGLVAIGKESADVTQILSAADAACYAAKAKGRNRLQMYRASDSELTRLRWEMGWVSRITTALDQGRMRLHYQTILPLSPPLSTSDPGAHHYEILLRMIDEAGNIVAPDTFIAAAERYNLMPAIDRWVIQTAFDHCARLYRAGVTSRPEICCINLSGASLGDEQLVGFIRQQVAAHRVPAESICFEITEAGAISNLEKAIHFIEQLRSVGFRFALDDVGSGLGSFAYLRNLRVDYLKIDGSFVAGIVDDQVSSAMVEAVHRIGHALGMQTIAECVESEPVLQKVRALGLDYAQGYAIARPRPLEGRVKDLELRSAVQPAAEQLGGTRMVSAGIRLLSGPG